MSIDISITGNPAERAVEIAAEQTGAASAQEYLQSRVQALCDEIVTQYSVGTIFSADFVLRFTPEENGAINAAAATDPMIADWLAQVRATPTVRLYSDTVVQGLAYLVAQNLITQARADVIGAY
jgi:hypothetical protein